MRKRASSRMYATADLQDVAAGEGEAAGSLPVVPENVDVAGADEDVVGGADDEAALPRDARLVGERRVQGQAWWKRSRVMPARSA